MPNSTTPEERPPIDGRAAAIEEGTFQHPPGSEDAAALLSAVAGAAPDAPPEDAAAAARAGYELRQQRRTELDRTRAQLETIQSELNTLRQKERDRELAEMSEGDRLRAERDEAQQRARMLEHTNRQSRVGAELGIPHELWPMLAGDSDELMRHQAERLRVHLARPRGPGGPAAPDVGRSGPARIFTRSELAKDVKLAQSDEVLQAMREGRIDMNR